MVKCAHGGEPWELGLCGYGFWGAHECKAWGMFVWAWGVTYGGCEFGMGRVSTWERRGVWCAWMVNSWVIVFGLGKWVFHKGGCIKKGCGAWFHGEWCVRG